MSVPGQITTRLIPIADPSALDEALKMLRAGEVIAFPTDTVYGVGCDFRSPTAIARLYAAKARPHNLAIPVLVSGPEHVWQVARDLPPEYEALVERFWPGGLTLVVPRRAELPEMLTAGEPTVAVRMPAHPWALELIAAGGGALAVTSANLSGHPSPVVAEDVLADLAGRIPLILDGGPCPGGVASSIIDLMANPPLLLRQGNLDLQTLRSVLPTLRARS